MVRLGHDHPEYLECAISSSRGIVPVLPSAAKSGPHASSLRPGAWARPLAQKGLCQVSAGPGEASFTFLLPLPPACHRPAGSGRPAPLPGKIRARPGTTCSLKREWAAAWPPVGAAAPSGCRRGVADQRLGRACVAQPQAGGTGTAPAGAETMAKRLGSTARSMDGPGRQLTRRGGGRTG
jgi:hypothetical protein